MKWLQKLRVTGSSAALLFLFCAPAVLAQEAVSTAHGSSRDSPDETVQSVPPTRGIEFPVAITTEVLGNLAGGSSRHVIWESLVNVGLALDLEKFAGWKGGNISVRAIYPQGTGLTSIAVHDFNTLSNIDGYDSLRLYDAWFQQEFADGKVSLRIGQLLADAEFFDSDNAALFLNSSFGAIPLVSQNLNPPIFPTAAPGIRLLARPLDSFYAETAIFSGDTGNPTLTNKHNTRLSFRSSDGVLIFAEMGYEWNMKREAETAGLPPLAGSLKVSGYYDSKEFSDSGGGSRHRGDYSVYGVFDQELWHIQGNKDRVLSCFSRAGGAPADRNTVTWYCDAGFNLKGLLAARAQDTLGIAFSHTELSHDLVDYSGRLLRSHHEEVLELTYQAVCNSHLSIQPDLQIIFNPGATMPANTAVVSGIRLDVQF
ncbi:MAG: carbohydrate porin [Chthoniobacterales bacterium]|nr:carbohydrate porin [Chthoniobacterales bacterium]